MSSNFSSASPKNIPPPMKLLSLTVISMYESWSLWGSCLITLWRIKLDKFIVKDKFIDCIKINQVWANIQTHKSKVSSNKGNKVLLWVLVCCFGHSWNRIAGTIRIETYGSHCPALVVVWKCTLAYESKDLLRHLDFLQDVWNYCILKIYVVLSISISNYLVQIRS